MAEIKSLKNGIKSLLSNRVCEITRGVIFTYGGKDWEAIIPCLKEWENKGYLKIIRDPLTSEDNQICVEMLTFFDYKSPIPDFLNYE